MVMFTGAHHHDFMVVSREQKRGVRNYILRIYVCAHPT
nr:MAG TPA: hypothetical protein [Caudoviricetes sp.]